MSSNDLPRAFLITINNI